jgi:hypothetical protein
MHCSVILRPPLVFTPTALLPWNRSLGSTSSCFVPLHQLGNAFTPSYSHLLLPRHIRALAAHSLAFVLPLCCARVEDVAIFAFFLGL